MQNKNINFNPNSYMIDQICIPATSVCIAEIATLPICTLKTNYQNTHSTSIVTTFKSMVEIAKKDYNRNYFKVFYRSSIPAISSQIFSTTSKLALYQHLRKFSNNLMLNGIVAGISVSLITHPLDAMKIRGQMRLSILLNETYILKSLYKGYTQSFLKTVVGGALYFPLYDHLKTYNLSSFESSALSAIISACLMHPFDYAKTRRCANLGWFVGYNPLSYTKGLHVNLLRIVPHFTIVMTLSDFLRKFNK